MKIYYSFVTIIFLASSISGMTAHKKADKKVTFFNKLDEDRTANELHDLERFHAIQQTQRRRYEHFNNNRDLIDRRTAINEIHYYFKPTLDGQRQQKCYNKYSKQLKKFNSKLTCQAKINTKNSIAIKMRLLLNTNSSIDQHAQKLNLSFEDYITLQESVILDVIKFESKHQTDTAISDALKQIKSLTAQKTISRQKIQKETIEPTQKQTDTALHNNLQHNKCCTIS